MSETARSRATATIDSRTEHLIALVKDDATLAEAARVYGISRERVVRRDKPAWSKE